MSDFWAHSDRIKELEGRITRAVSECDLLLTGWDITPGNIEDIRKLLTGDLA